MNKTTQILYIYTETPLHAGTGTGLGAVDLPIQREKHTNYPIIQASGVKGSLRDTLEPKLEPSDIDLIFGGASGNPGEDFAGAISPSDARILLFPIRALKGVFVWATSPTTLIRFAQETNLSKAIPTLGAKVKVSDGELLSGNQIMLEEYAYAAEADNQVKEFAAYLAEEAIATLNAEWRKRLASHLVILPDDEFRDFVTYGTDIVTRIHLDDVTKTVKQGQLFTQELLPADSLLYSVVQVSDTRNRDKDRRSASAKDIIGLLEEKLAGRIQIGADETVGRGRVRLNWRAVK